MSKIIFINPIDIEDINVFSYFRNEGIFSKYIDPIDYQFILFSTLYQSGVNYFQTDIRMVPESIIINEFWKNRIIAYDKKIYTNSLLKTNKITKGKFNIEEDGAKTNLLIRETISHFSNFIYSAESGVPFLNTHYYFPKYLEIMKRRIDQDFFAILNNLSSLIKEEGIRTVTPKYSILKNDLKRFEDIANTGLFEKYSKSLNLLTESTKLSTIKKDIAFYSYRLLNKFGSSLNLKDTTLNFIKFNKKILDQFIGKFPSAIGDTIIQSVEKMIQERNKIFFYEIEDVKIHVIFCNSLQDCIDKHGFDILKTLVEDYKKIENSH